MKAAERERLLVSLFSAVVLHVFIVLLLGLVDLQEDLSLSRTLGPVTVRLQQVPPPSVPEPVLPQQTEPRMQEPQIPQAAPAQGASQPPAAGSRPSAAASSAAQPQPSVTESADTQTSRPFWEQPKGEYSGVESGPAEDQRVPAARDPEQRAVARSSEAPEYGEPVPQKERRWVEESRVITEKPADTSRVGGGGDEARTGQGTGASDSVLSEELRRQIEGISAAGDSSGTAGRGGTAGEGKTSGTADGTAADGAASGRTAGSSADAPFRIEGVQDRDLLFYRLPELTEQEKARLPSSLEIAVGFDLMPSGIPANVHLTRGPSTGHPEIDSKIVEAVRSWKFSALPEGSTDEVTGIIRIVIRAR